MRIIPRAIVRYVPIFFALPHANATPLADMRTPDTADIIEKIPVAIDQTPFMFIT